MDKLDNDTFQEILSRLPIKSLLQCQSVCRRMRNLTHGPHFALIHKARSTPKPGFVLNTSDSVGDGSSFNNQIFLIDRRSNATIPTCFPLKLFIPNFNEVYLTNSCNGLLLFASRAQNITTMFVCNPFLSEFFELPINQYQTNQRMIAIHFDFGFCPKTKSYQIIEISNFIVQYNEHNLEHRTEIHVHKLGEDCWNRKEWKMKFVVKKSGSACNVNGALHWVSEFSAAWLTVFDIERDMFKEMSGPVREIGYFSTGVIENCLSIFKVHGNILDVWIMKEYWVSWEKSIVVDLNEVFDPALEFRVFGYAVEDGELFIFHDRKVLTYNIEENAIKSILTIMEGGWYNFILPSNSFDLTLPL